MLHRIKIPDLIPEIEGVFKLYDESLFENLGDYMLMVLEMEVTFQINGNLRKVIDNE